MSDAQPRTLSRAERGFMGGSLVQLTLVRFREFVREPEAVFWTFIFPILMAGGLGIAFRDRAPDVIKVGVVGTTSTADGVRKAIEKSGGLSAELFADDSAAQQALRTGRVALVALPAAGSVTYRFDDTNPDGRSARMLVDQAVQRAAGRADPIAVHEQRVREVGSRYIDFLVPGLLGMNLMGSSMWGIGFSVVNARLRKLLKRLIATPMRKSHYLLAQLLMRMAFLVLEVGILVAFAWIFFGVRVRGSLLLFTLICFLGGSAFAGIGLLVASRARTLEAVSGLMNFVMVPMWICSGVFFSYERFPDAAKPFIRALPLTALNDALRGVMNDGFGIAAVAPQIGVLVAWSVIGYVIGLKIFRWQ